MSSVEIIINYALYSNTLNTLNAFAPERGTSDWRSSGLVLPRCNAAPRGRWSAVCVGHFWPDVYFRLLPNALDSRTARHIPHTQTPKHRNTTYNNHYTLQTKYNFRFFRSHKLRPQ